MKLIDASSTISLRTLSANRKRGKGFERFPRGRQLTPFWVYSS
jgi:hypothetical protein